MKIYIKYMETLRSLLVVKDHVERLGLEVEELARGELWLKDPVPSAVLEELSKALQLSGMLIIQSPRHKLVEKIKSIVMDLVYSSDEPLMENFSTYLVRLLPYDYTYLSNLFAANQGITLEHYLIATKIEKVKELLIYEEMTIAAIAIRMNYSSAAHLSKQFKQVTGVTATHFKNLKRLPFADFRKGKAAKETAPKALSPTLPKPPTH